MKEVSSISHEGLTLNNQDGAMFGESGRPARSRFAKALAWIAGAYALLTLCSIGRTTLWNIDEGRIAEVAREMAASGDFLVPRIGGIPFASYPPLSYWLMAGSGTVLGFNEFAMRLPSALAGIGLVVLLGLIGRKLAGPAAGLAAAMVLATTAGFYKQEIMCRADVLTAFFAVWAWHHFLNVAEGPSRPRDAAGFYAACALGTLAKGPVALVVAGMGVLAWLAVRRRASVIADLKPAWGIPLFLLAVVPWYAAVYRAEGGPFLRINLMMENASAFVTGYQQRRPVYFYLGQIPLTTFPWFLLLPAAFRARRMPGMLVALFWLTGIFLFFTASSAKRPSYLAYVYPAFALAAGLVLADRLKTRPRALRLGLRATSLAIGAGAAAAALVPRSLWAEKADALLDYRFAGAAVLAAFAAAVFAASRKPRRGAVLAAGGVAVGLALFGIVLAPLLDRVGRDGAAFCRRVAARGEPVGVMGPEETEGAFHFYAGAVLPLRKGEPGLYVLTEPQRDRLLASGRAIEILDQTLDERRRAKILARVGSGGPP
jgi:4-amino-4-deoxy-L-arabinose transferase-like glycosyltransferase